MLLFIIVGISLMLVTVNIFYCKEVLSTQPNTNIKQWLLFESFVRIQRRTKGINKLTFTEKKMVVALDKTVFQIYIRTKKY